MLLINISDFRFFIIMHYLHTETGISFSLMGHLAPRQTLHSPNTVVMGKKSEIYARLVTTTVKDFVFERNDFPSVVTASLMASTWLIII